MSVSSRILSSADRQRGRSIIEVMVAMTISLFVMATVLALVAGSSRGSRTQDSQSKLTENAQVALNLITGHLRMSGYSTPRVNAIPGAAVANYEGAAVRGCAGGFTNPAEPDMALTLCAGGAGAEAISIAYEADVTNTLVLAANLPTDCLGQALLGQASAFGGVFYVAENRFYIDAAGADPVLVCDGSGGPGFGNPQALISNVENFQILYGVSDTGVTQFGNTEFNGRTEQYLTANQLDAQFVAEGVMTRWSRVSSVRVCLLMRTADNVTDEPTPFFDCQGNAVNSADRRLRFAVSSTVNVRNNSAVVRNL